MRAKVLLVLDSIGKTTSGKWYMDTGNWCVKHALECKLDVELTVCYQAGLRLADMPQFVRMQSLDLNAFDYVIFLSMANDLVPGNYPKLPIESITEHHDLRTLHPVKTALRATRAYHLVVFGGIASLWPSLQDSQESFDFHSRQTVHHLRAHGVNAQWGGNTQWLRREFQNRTLGPEHFDWIHFRGYYRDVAIEWLTSCLQGVLMCIPSAPCIPHDMEDWTEYSYPPGHPAAFETWYYYEVVDRYDDIECLRRYWKPSENSDIEPYDSE